MKNTHKSLPNTISQMAQYDKRHEIGQILNRCTILTCSIFHHPKCVNERTCSISVCPPPPVVAQCMLNDKLFYPRDTQIDILVV